MDEEELIVEHLLKTVTCSICQNRYTYKGVRVLGHQSDLWFLSVECSQCHYTGLIAALVTNPPEDSESKGTDADTTSQQQKGQPISAADEVALLKTLGEKTVTVEDLIGPLPP